MKERISFETEFEDLDVLSSFKEFQVSGRIPVATIGFEFDINYGSSKANPPPDRPDYDLEGLNVTTHRKRRDNFRLEGDGNRIEIATEPFELNSAGRARMQGAIKKILDWVKVVIAQSKIIIPARLGYSSKIGDPIILTHPDLKLEPSVACIFPISMMRKDPYYPNRHSVAASPQATIELPLSNIDKFIKLIKLSESKIAGKSLSGPGGRRPGVRSDALYKARIAVNKSRSLHIKRKTKLSDKSIVTYKNYSSTLQGFLILIVSYLTTSEIAYWPHDPLSNKFGDYEAFAKAYLPLNVKNHFRELYADLLPEEKIVFRELYYDGANRVELWKLANAAATATSGSKVLFPSQTHILSRKYFRTLPTWTDFIEMTVLDRPLLRTEAPTDPHPKHSLGDEVLFAPLSKSIQYNKGSRRVTVEMRRLGFNWVFAFGYTSKGVSHPGWRQMTNMLFDLAVNLNK